MRLQSGFADQSLQVMVEGYGWMPNLRRRTARDVVRTRVMGQRAVGLCGPQAAQFFYDEKHVQRHGAIPSPVLSTLFGHGAVHTLDGDAHRSRKSFFLSVVTPESIASLVQCVAAAWEDTVIGWPPGREVVLFDEASRALTAGVRRWAGLPVETHEVKDLAADLVAMVDGFATAGPRHWRARWARNRREAWLASLILDVRDGKADAPAGSALDIVARSRELDLRTAAVELLNVIRPTVAVCWFVAYAGHALHMCPQYRQPLQADGEFAVAFAHELRRFYPFAPFIGGRAVQDLTYEGEDIPAGSLVLLDLYGQNHDSRLWTDPYRFDPRRFLDHEIGEWELVPQGAGDPHTGHRCPGEPFTVAILAELCTRLAHLDYEVPDQDMTISLSRIPARPRSGFVLVPTSRH
ncbi:cytochrome P450 [Kibdelosporangium aridum]|uniref:Fatty-acid peroxygenase n=1 Tax=Kibdelosporangium aridum TaxID=2030 RepID=A0A1W2FV25_KIBAR|nr:cytochrome P450 [Kibdelosporangium aridum]SMD25827.1 fatty-acid peroxygenase [Kibdelosporangium aridum]